MSHEDTETLADMARIPPVTAPEGLSAAGKKRYMAVVDHLSDRWNAVWEPIVRRYCMLMDAAESAWQALPKMQDGTPRLTTSGSQGDKQKVQHPLWRAYLDASKAAAGVAAELGITPRQMAEAIQKDPDNDPLAD